MKSLCGSFTRLFATGFFAVLTAQGQPGVSLTASLGFPARSLDPLVDPNPLFLFPGQTATVTIRVASVNSFQGQVKMFAGCCDDLSTGASVPNALHLEFPNNTGANGVFLTVPPPPGPRLQLRGIVSSVDAVLEIRADPSAVPRKLRINLKAETAPGVVATAGVAVEILPPVPPDRGTVPPCVSEVIVGSSGGTQPGFPELLPLSKVTTDLLNSKRTSPAKTSFSIGAASKTNMAGWQIDIAKASTSLTSNESIVFLSNTSGTNKEMSAVDSTNCVAARQTVIVPNGGTASLMITKADTTTIVLRRPFCSLSFIGCLQHTWVDFAVFDTAAFWSLFGGRQITINWFYSTNE